MYLHEGDKLRIASRAISQQQTTLPGGAFLSLNIYLPELLASLWEVTEGGDLRPILSCTGAPKPFQGMKKSLLVSWMSNPCY